jgi:activator of HSP90 ATPase
MAKTIIQKVLFKNTTAKAVYSLYMDAKKHALISGAPAVISAKEGTKYAVHGEYIKGKTLQVIKDKLIVQSWRAIDWTKDDVDSTFIIHLEQKGKNVELQAIHANIPDQTVKSIGKGWFDHYWNPYKQYLAGKPIKRPVM